MNAQRQMEEDRALRDAARALVRDDIDYLRSDLEEKGIVARVGHSMILGLGDIVDEGRELVEQHKPASYYGLGGILATIIGWWALSGDAEGEYEDDYRRYDEDD